MICGFSQTYRLDEQIFALEKETTINVKCNLEEQFKWASFDCEESADQLSTFSSGPKTTDSVAAHADQSACLGEQFNLNKWPERSLMSLGKRSPLERDIFLVSKVKKRQRKRSFDFTGCTQDVIMESCIKRRIPTDLSSLSQAEHLEVGEKVVKTLEQKSATVSTNVSVKDIKPSTLFSEIQVCLSSMPAASLYQVPIGSHLSNHCLNRSSLAQLYNQIVDSGKVTPC